MKHCYVMVMVLYAFYFGGIHAADDKNPPTTTNNTINAPLSNIAPNISPHFYPNISPVTNIFIGITQEMATNIQLYISTQITALYNAAHRAYEKTCSTVESCADWASNNKIKLTLYTSAALYAYITYKLFTLKYMLVQPDNWSLWNNTLSYDDLRALSEKQLAETLIKEAQQRYTVIHEPENFMLPIVTFLQTVEHEKQILQGYRSLCGWITTLHLNKIMWFDEQLERACEERLKRLAYLRAIFINWITEYKFIQNAQPKAAA